MAAPPGTPAKQAKILEQALLKAMADKEYNAFIKKSGLVLDAGDAKRANKDVADLVAVYRKYMPAIRKTLGK